MATDPKSSLPPTAAAESLPLEVHQALASGLGDLNLRELLSWLLSTVGLAERKAYLERILQDKPNGFYQRSLELGTIPLEVRVPRTRSGDFRPASLPAPYQRGYSEEIQALLLGLLASSRSLNAAKDALQKMGLSSSQQDLDRVASGLIEELELRNSRPLDCDLLALFLDGKYVEFRDGDRLRPACIDVVVGLRRDGRKQVLTCLARVGRENLEDWKTVLRGLLERGLRRVLIVVHDDFSGLLPVTQSLFPNSDVQLCAVHMQRNAKTHLNKADAIEFQQRWRAIKSSWNLELAHQQFEELCDRFAKTSLHRRAAQETPALPGLPLLPGIDSPFFLYHQHRGSDQRPTRNPAPQQRWLLPFRRYLEAETRAGDLFPRGRSVAKCRSFHLRCASST